MSNSSHNTEDEASAQNVDSSRPVVVVTGAAVRLGKAIALAIAEELQWNVVVHFGRSQTEAESTVKEITSLGVKAVAVSADLSKPEAAAKTVFGAAAKLGPVTALINCAAGFEDQPVGQITEAHCMQQFSVNTFAPLFLAQELHLQLPNDTTGHIVNLLDWRAIRPPATHLVYTASKAALASLTKGLAQQLAPRIHVNGIAPGAILPPEDTPDWHKQRAKDSIPLQRPGSPADICQAAIFLLRSTFITGEILHVSGGEHL